MKNILIRAGISPLDNYDAAHILDKNSIGGNVGNLIYQYSVIRNLMTENTNITPDNYSRSLKNADMINEKYDAYVIPLADAFRQDFAGQLRDYTKLIKKLKIPVVVVGVGLRAPFEPKLNEGFPFDEDVKEFVKAVLEKSNMIGVRGQITADYLTRLGFIEGVDHTVIGCPSMYSFGPDLKIRDTEINENSTVGVNSSLLSPKHVLDFITKSMKQFSDHYFIPQWKSEMELTYLGYPPIRKKQDNYPTSMLDSVYKEDRVRFFLSAPSWIDFMSKLDFSFGARLHGNITATIAGTPSLIIPKDARMRELAEYHNLTSLWHNDIKEDTNIMDVIETVDFKSPEKVQARNFNNFINFLEKNGLEHIYSKGPALETIPLDKRLEEVDLLPPIGPISGINIEELAQRWDSYLPLIESKNKRRTANRIKRYEKRIKQKDKKIKEMRKKIKHLEGTLNRKSVRYTLGLADKIAARRKKS